MSNKAKGTRREREARDIYGAAGYATQAFHGNRYREKDGFGLFDFVALNPDHPVRFVQVKSNTARGIQDWCESVKYLGFLETDHYRAEYVVAHDNEGWRMLVPEYDSYTTEFDGRESSLSVGGGLREYLRIQPPMTDDATEWCQNSTCDREAAATVTTAEGTELRYCVGHARRLKKAMPQATVTEDEHDD